MEAAIFSLPSWGQGQGLGPGNLLKVSTQDVTAQLGWQSPSDFSKSLEMHQSMKDKYSLCKACYSRGLPTSGVDSLPCVIGNSSESITIRGMWLPWSKVLLNASLSKEDGEGPHSPSCLLMFSVSKGSFPRGFGRDKCKGKKISPSTEGFCPLMRKQQHGMETSPPYLPGYSWIQIAFELLNVCMGRILHLESFLKEAQRQTAWKVWRHDTVSYITQIGVTAWPKSIPRRNVALQIITVH